MKKHYALVILPLLFMAACTGPAHETRRPIKKKTLRNAAADSVSSLQPEETNELAIFNSANWTKYRESTIAYYAKNHPELTGKVLRIDSAETGNYKLYEFRSINFWGGRTFYETEISLYVFATAAEATDHFNDLKTRDLILPFGINKSPNHILVNDNYVFWHHFTHGNGHKMKKIKNTFRKVFGFHPHAPNLDSVSGFNYCSCHDDDAKLEALAGKWISKQHYTWENTDSLLNNRRNFYRFPDTTVITSLELRIRKDTIIINGVKYGVHYKSSRELPSSRYFARYFFDRHYMQRAWLSRGAQKIINAMEDIEQHMVYYTFSLDQRGGLDVFYLEDGSTFALYGNNFFTLRKKR